MQLNPVHFSGNIMPPGAELLFSLQAHEKPVLCVAFDPRGATLASGDGEGKVKFWEIDSGKLLRSLDGHQGVVYSVTFSPDGGILACGGDTGTVQLWDVYNGRLLRTIYGHQGPVTSLAFDRQTLASGSGDGRAKLWNIHSGDLRIALTEGQGWIWSVAFGPEGQTLASAGNDGSVRIWERSNLNVPSELARQTAPVFSVACDPQGSLLASGGGDGTVKLWELKSGKLLRALEGHTGSVTNVAFSCDGRLLASKSNDHTIRLWRCASWETIAVIPALTDTRTISALAFHPTLPLLAASAGVGGNAICIWKIDIGVLLSRLTTASEDALAVHHTTGKIVLVGDHGVGKSALGHRLIYGRFERQESTHGQQFWVFPELGRRRIDGTECEAILWDFAGQPDYRLVHALFVDNADLALVMFDASDIRDPLRGVEFWLKQLRAGQNRCPIILVAAQIDRGTSPLTHDELEAFCRKHGIAGPNSTSALTGAGIDELVSMMKSMVPWDDKPATVTTATFKRIKDYVLGLKGIRPDREVIVTSEHLRARLEAIDVQWRFTDAEMLTAVGHLENYGYTKRLRTSKGEQRILLQPERLNNLASSFVLEARRNPKGLGALEEKRLLAGGYDFPELKDLSASDRDVLLDSAALLFLEHNVCFRETDPLRVEPYLVFPELINLKKPPGEEAALEDGAVYTVSGATENVFASLVVLLGYTHTFTRTTQWRNNARYEMGDGLVCGFHQEAARDGELDLALCFGHKAGLPARTLFQGLFESFLARRNLTVTRYEPVLCSNVVCGHVLDHSVTRQRLKEGKSFAFCNECGEKMALPAMAEPIQLTRDVQTEVDAQRHAAEQRTRFEQAVFRLRAYVVEQKIESPETFLSYAWGEPEHERWVEKRLAIDLQKAGIDVVLDRWHNALFGLSVARFVDRIETIDRIVVIGTPNYRRKYDNMDISTGFVVAAEVDLINDRLLGTEAQKQTVIPVLLDGDKANSLPPLLHGRTYASFRDELTYFATAFDLILSLYQLPFNHPAVEDLRESLRERALR
jgi:small GTP-binding protein